MISVISNKSNYGNIKSCNLNNSQLVSDDLNSL